MGFESTLDVSSTTVTGQNTTSETTLYNETVDGGLLDTDGRIKWDMSGRIGFATSGSCTLRAKYGGSLLASCVLAVGTAISATGLNVTVKLNGAGSVSSQSGTIEAYAGIVQSNDSSTPVGWGTTGIASGAAATFTVTAQWAAAATNSLITHSHSILTLMGEEETEEAEELDEPTFQILGSTRLNRLHYTVRKYAYFYAPLEHDLTFFGYGSSTFTRASTSTATWRDGASHSIAVDQPRFEYSGDNVTGLKLSVASETLTFASANNLSDSNTLCYLLEGVYKSTLRGDTNIFNGSGTVTGLSNQHLMHVVKFNKVLTLAEDQLVETALTS